MTVTQWPAYLLRSVPADTRALLSARAEQDDMSLADVVRQALCARYRMDCDKASNGYQPELDTGNPVLIVRLQPEVWRLMKKETRGRYGETRKLILESLTDYLEATTCKKNQRRIDKILKKLGDCCLNF